jgi:hypothetical protein
MSAMATLKPFELARICCDSTRRRVRTLLVPLTDYTHLYVGCSFSRCWLGRSAR